MNRWRMCLVGLALSLAVAVGLALPTLTPAYATDATVGADLPVDDLSAVAPPTEGALDARDDASQDPSAGDGAEADGGDAGREAPADAQAGGPLAQEADAAQGAGDLVPQADGASSITVTYDANGGTWAASSGSNKQVSAATVTVDSGETLSRSGFIFEGWNTAADGTGTPYAAGATVSETLILYAQWRDRYEALEIESGFNRDVIAEVLPVAGHAVSYYNLSGTQFSFATKSVIYQVMNNAATAETGFPEDGRVDCLSTAYDGLYWQLAPFDAANAMCLRNINGAANRGTFTFKKVGCYQYLYFLVIAGGVSGTKTMNTVIHYSDGSQSNSSFTITDHAQVPAANRACHDNYTAANGRYNSPNSYAELCSMSVDTSKLITSVEIINTSPSGSGIAILAVTGLTAELDPPSVVGVDSTTVSSDSFQLSWEADPHATGYAVDVATSSEFQEGFVVNNQLVEGTTLDVAGLDPDTEYYYRIRSVDSTGAQSASSETGTITTPKGTPVLDAAPVAQTLTYAGQGQALVSAGTSQHGTLVYSLDGTTWSDTIPTGTYAGTYTVHYYLRGDQGYLDNGSEDAPLGSVDVTILPKEVTVTPDATGKYYGEDDPTLTVTADGLVGSDTLAAVSAGTISRAPGEEPGTYAYDQGTLALTSANYTLVWANPDNHLFTVHKALQAPPAVTPGVYTMTLAEGHGVENAGVEYRLKGGGDDAYTFLAGQDGSIDISGLRGGTYEVRYAETAHFQASDAVEVVVDGLEDIAMTGLRTRVAPYAVLGMVGLAVLAAVVATSQPRRGSARNRRGGAHMR